MAVVLLGLLLDQAVTDLLLCLQKLLGVPCRAPSSWWPPGGAVEQEDRSHKGCVIQSFWWRTVMLEVEEDQAACL